MKLVDFAFQKVKSGEKDIEVRLNDEKRQLIKIGDIIEFSHIETGEILKVKVINLYKYDTFKELFDNFDKIEKKLIKYAGKDYYQNIIDNGDKLVK